MSKVYLRDLKADLTSKVITSPLWYIMFSLFGLSLIVLSLVIPDLSLLPLIFQNIGGVFIATGIVLYMENHIYKHRFNGITRPPPHYYLPYVTGRLNIMGITLDDFHKDGRFIDELISKSETDPIGVKYKFLMLFPLSKHLYDRESEEGKFSGELKKECDASLCYLLKLRKEVCKNPLNSCEIKFYDIPPRRSVIITDRKIFVGPYLFGVPGIKSRWMQITNKNMFCQYSTEFDEIWNNKSTSLSHPYDSSLPYDSDLYYNLCEKYCNTYCWICCNRHSNISCTKFIEEGYKNLNFRLPSASGKQP